MSALDLSKYGIEGVTEIYHNLSYDELFKHETNDDLEGYEKSQISELGAVNVMTGVFTGRSPKDKYIVLMTDGITGYECGDCVYNTPCGCDRVHRRALSQRVETRRAILGGGRRFQ